MSRRSREVREPNNSARAREAKAARETKEYRETDNTKKIEDIVNRKCR